VAATSAVAGLPFGSARAETPGVDRNFIFLYTLGGWDVSRVFSPELLDFPDVDTESTATAAQAGNLPFVDHPDRPSVREFYEAAASEFSVINGVFVPTVSHDIARRLMISADPSSASPDWATRIAAARYTDFLAPHLCIAGPVSAGSLGAHLVRSGFHDQLDGLASGEIMERTGVTTTPLTDPQEEAVQRVLQQIARERSLGTGSQASAAEDYLLSIQRGDALREVAGEIDLQIGRTFSEQVTGAMEALSRGISRTVSIAYPSTDNWVAWDSHALNDEQQSPLFEGLFASLQELRNLLLMTPGQRGGSLYEETVVVVLSEMGRTPTLNGARGKDHWHYTSSMLWGPGVQGGQSIGGFDESQLGLPIHSQSGELDENGSPPSIDSLGATLLTLAGLDPANEGVPAEVIEALIQSS
jgi:uncharacterized protein (DUF1501 family)